MDMDRSAPATTEQRWRRFAIFARNFIRHPLSVGTFAPSSSYLVRRVLEQADFSRARVVVEYGPGLGTISGALLERLRSDAHLLLIETNPEFVECLQEQFRDHRVIVERGSAAEVSTLLARHGLARADVIVSGIPFSTLAPGVRDQILEHTADSLQDDGRFVVYQYTKAVLRHLGGRFRVARHSTEWRNTWPAQVFDCRKPQAPA
jgi:phosphatidylethanolamine/phosphatidyl-N-methylethanolamine N-methyltransferase